MEIKIPEGGFPSPQSNSAVKQQASSASTAPDVFEDVIPNASGDGFVNADSEITPDLFGFTDADLSPKIIDTQTKSDGLNKCPKCGATDISFSQSKGVLRCNFCRHEFKPQTLDALNTDVTKLHGEFRGAGTQSIQEDANDVVTMKCQGCGAEVVVPTAESTQARCHWCRSYLSINNQLPNGAVPDAILPFALDRENARAKINEFVGRRRFYAHPRFKAEFTTENVMGVYFPYYIVDANAHATFNGVGEHLVRSYTVGSGNSKKKYYDADEYMVERDFDLGVEKLTVEASSDKLNVIDDHKTTNIINSIMPFDTENCVSYDANYLRGFSSEKRDTNVEQVRNIVKTQVQDVARHSITDTLGLYDRGVRWENETVQVKGQRWSTAYLPVWLYSYYQPKNDGSGQLHYVAVNARTQETMGSVPIHYPKLIGISAIIEILALLIMIPLLLLDFSGDDPSGIEVALALAGFAYYFMIFAKYRNKDARHFHEKETRTNVYNLKKQDNYLRRRERLRNAQIAGNNCYAVNGTLTSFRLK